MTLDEARGAFESSPCPATAYRYAQEAVCYHDDEMIGDETRAAIMAATAPYLETQEP